MIRAWLDLSPNTRVNREICGGAAVFYRPFDHEHAADKLISVMTDQGLQKQLRTEAANNLSNFDCSWRRYVLEVVSLY